MHIILNSLIILILLSVPAFGTTYYVTVGGSDVADGLSWTNAWSSFSYACSTITCGDTVLFGSGTYYGSYWQPPTNFSSGCDGTSMTVLACSSFAYIESDNAAALAGKYLPHINAGEVLTGWTLYSGNVYQKSWTPSYPGNTNVDGWGVDQCWTLGQVGISIDTFLCPIYSDTGNGFVGAGAWVAGNFIDSVNQAGDFIHDTATDVIYAWVYGDDDPDNYTMIASVRPVLELRRSGVHHIKFWGLSLEYGTKGVILWSNAGFTDSLFFEHCNITRCGYPRGSNVGLFASGLLNSPYLHNRTFVTACSLSTAVQGTFGGASSPFQLGSGCNLYSANRVVFDSCVIRNISKGVFIKKSDDCSDGLGIGNTVKFTRIEINNVLSSEDSPCIQFMNSPNYDSVYGCILIGGQYGISATYNGCERYTEGSPTYSRQNYRFLNNTIYNVKNSFIGMRHPTGWTDIDSCVVKYNVGYLSMDSTIGYDRFDLGFTTGPDFIDTFWRIDSNSWYDDNALILFTPDGVPDPGGGGISRNWAEWTGTDGHDEHSFNTDCGLNTTTFALPDTTSLTMNATYGGRTWTVWGAVQPDSSFSILGVDTTTTTVTIQFTYAGYTVDTINLFYDTDGTIADADSVYDISALGSPDSLQVTGLTANTGYDFWGVISYGGTHKDTTAMLEITTDAVPVASGNRVLIRK